MRMKLAILAAGASLSLGGCAYGGLSVGTGFGNGYYDDYGYGYGGSRYGYGYDPYGYDRYGYDRYGYGYNPYGYSPYGYSPYGWYGNSYYPGRGYYVYDRNRQRRQMTDAERRYWSERLRRTLFGDRAGATSQKATQPAQENWSGFEAGPQARDMTRRGATRGPGAMRNPEVVQQRQQDMQRRLEQRRERVQERRSDNEARRSELRARLREKLEERRQSNADKN